MRTILRRQMPHFNKKTAIAVLIEIAVISAAAMLLSKTTDPNSENVLKMNTVEDYPWRVEHYSSFLTERSTGSIRLLWENSVFKMTKNEKTLKQRAVVYPITLENKNVKYSISDTSIAEIDSEGNITAKKPGEVIVKAKLENNGYTRESRLVIKQGVESIFLPNTNLTLNTGDPYTSIKAQVFPENAADKSITWTSKDPKVAIVDSNSAVKPVSTGMTEITAVTTDGGFSAKCFVQVINKVIKPGSVEILNKDSAYLETGQSMTMIATVGPSNAKDKTVSWSSSNKNVATVSATGKIKALAEGSTDITVRTSNGKNDKVTLTVSKSTSENPLVLYDKQTSANEVPKDILGDSYINTSSSSRVDGAVTYVSCSSTFEEALDKQMSLATPRKLWTRANPQSIATRAQVAEYMNPQNYRTGVYKFQFLDLAHPNGLSADELNKYLADKGSLKGMGQAFIDVANEYNISEIYLVIHACLETGNGTSQLGTGVMVNGVKVYNMFGIAAYDASAVYSGSQKAYKEGWTSPEAAIRGGGAWISENYVNNPNYRQNTLYDIIWNPENPGTHQYATDISWAMKQSENMARMYDRFPGAVFTYEVPVYAGETAAVLE